MSDEAPEKMKRDNGGRNLAILGITSVLIAIVTSLASLYIYHKSGDIYLDCSLPDADCPSARSDSEENDKTDVYVFSDSGDLNEKVLDEYLKELEKISSRVRKMENPFGGDALSDESLGI
ncbi:hypothetical protein J6W91_00670 [Candidatus Saccharibacteria bacterium]|nr:hypothetical protein [Candidatus Saccharibacteria bacterium]